MSAIELLGPWRSSAACFGLTELMFAEDQVGQARAVRVCMSCAVRAECLADARATETSWEAFGTRGGLTSSERAARKPRRPRPSGEGLPTTVTDDIEPAPRKMTRRQMIWFGLLPAD